MAMVEVEIHAHREFAVMTALLVGVFVAAQLHVTTLGEHASPFLQEYGAVPAKLLALIHWRHPYRTLYAVQAILSSMFLHENWIQVAINVLFLLLFGASVEDRLGHYRFLLLFFVCGGLAILAQALFAADSQAAFVGAQGGVAGIAGACLTISSRNGIATMIRGFSFPWVVGPVAWLMGAILISASPLPSPPGIAVVGFPYLGLAYAAGAALGPLYLYLRPALLRG